MPAAGVLLPSRGGRVPKGYRTVVLQSARAFVLAEAEGWVCEALGGADTVHEWAAARHHAEFSGRERVFVVTAPCPGPDGRASWAVRHYRRGGAMAMHMVDRYMRVGRSRPERELHASAAARSRGVQTPAIICGVVYSDGLYYRADVVTEVVPEVRTLAQRVHEHDGTRDWLVAMARAGALIRQLADSGIHHVDLNAHNVLLGEDPDEAAWVVDLDRARVLRRPSTAARERMLARLTRSIVKVGTPTGEHLGHDEVASALGQMTVPL